MHDIRKIPGVRLVESNTDAIEFEIDEDKLPLAKEVMEYWQKRYRLELEDDYILKLVMRDVNNFCEVLQTPYGKEVKFKGQVFASCPKIKLHEDGRIETIRKVNLKNNTMSIVAEAVLKKLLFDIPVEKTINNCNDIFCFQIISHLGSTYEKCVQESPNGDIELQRNNRVYAGLKESGIIIKVKEDGRRDSLPLCPPNPIIDNANQCKIEDINKEWYIELAKQRVNDFLGIKRLEEYKKDELLELAKELNIEVDKKTKKEELIKIIKQKRKGDNVMATKQELEEKLIKATEQNEKLVEKLKEKEKEPIMMPESTIECKARLYSKINEFRKLIRQREFVLDKELPSNLGGGEYYSIDQFYNAIQEVAVEVGLDFSFETIEVTSFEKELIKPAGRNAIHVATVKCTATLTDINTGESKEYVSIAQGSDSIDKAVSGASTLAFRQWFYKNFTPKNMTEDDLDKTPEVEKSTAPKVPVYIPEEKKEEIKKEVVAQVQQEPSDDEDIKVICENIMKIRELSGDNEYGAKTLDKVLSGELSSTDLLEIDLKIKNKLEKLGA